MREELVDQGLYKIATKRVRDLPLRQQPRELLDCHGAEHVPDSVLLAILLRSGVQGRNVVELASGLLEQYGTLTAMAKASLDELASHHGMGKVKAQVLKSALELARRMTEEAAPARPIVRTPAEVAAVLRENARLREMEVFWVLLLDTKYRLHKPPHEVTRGILDASLVHPREVFCEAIRSMSAAVVLVHNHPSGDPSPSPEDIRITKKLVAAGKTVEIDVLDHVILGSARDAEGEDYFSLRESGLVEFSG